MVMDTDETQVIELKPEIEAALHSLDAEVSDIEVIAAAKEILLLQPTLAKRESVINQIPGFWGVVFAHAAPEFVGTFTPQDAKVMSDALIGLRVTRPEMPASATAATNGPLSAFGEPRTFTLHFRFAANEWFADSELSKTFYHRYDADGDPTLVSEPVKIAWKPGKDLTEGLTDAAHALYVAQGKAGQLDCAPTRAARKARDAATKQLPEYQALAALLKQRRAEDSEGDKQTGAASFFNLFAYRGDWIGKSEDASARREKEVERSAWAAGKVPEEKVEAEEEDDEDEDEDYETTESAVEPSPLGYDIADTIADSVWPRAIHYFFNDDDEAYFEDLDDESDEEDDDDAMEE